MDTYLFKNIITALFLGLIVGVERERSDPSINQALGIRTFGLLTILGVLAQFFWPTALSYGIVLFVVVSITLAYLRSSQQDAGLTTEVAAMTMFCVGYLVSIQVGLSIGLTAIVLALLVLKEKLQHFSSKLINRRELQMFSVLFLLYFAITPMIVDRTLDPWQLFNLNKFIKILSLIIGIQFIGHILHRTMGQKLALPIQALLGGIFSSTALILQFLEQNKKQTLGDVETIRGIFFATASSLVMLMIVLLNMSWQLGIFVLPIFIFIIAVCLIIGLFWGKHQHLQFTTVPINDPLDWKSILKLTAILIFLIVLSSLIKYFIGEQALLVLSFSVGLFELHAISFSLANHFQQMTVSLDTAVTGIMLAVIGSLFSKLIISIIWGRGKARLWTSILLLPLIFCGLSIFLFRWWRG